ncbi:radical SAM family heme chaperone HemW [Jannaschia sp. 2305UL9-9]|uniref:radical SAM family heme chaperone HemW n=1 Tax=Jannaschia sp. 2305UL9-9 TaxID=3121638 RepID=UPI003528766E
MENWQVGGFGIYVHWPFCAAKCPYCDFNSHVSRGIDQVAYRKAYLSEIDHWADQTEGRVVSSVFFGGGTPSLMDPDTTAAILDRIAGRWTMANDLEVTLEANPTSVEAGRFRAFAGAGVNRFSVGLQALNDGDLTRLGRLHSVDEGRRAYEIARDTCDRVSFDLIYARQDQSLAAWEAELRTALAMEPDHLSLYQLTIEEGTAFGDRAAIGRLGGLPSEDLSADMYDLTQAMTAQAGIPRYEISNHARPGAESRHNLIYWRGGDWLGIGPGAHGRVALNGHRTATRNAMMPEVWRSLAQTRGHGAEERQTLQNIDTAEELLLMSLRLRDGLDLDRLHTLGFCPDDAAIQSLVDQGVLVADQTTLRATDRGTPVLNQVIGGLLPLQPVG